MKNKKRVLVLAALGFLGIGIFIYQYSQIHSFPINTADTIASWNFKGATDNNTTLTTQVTDDISKLSDLIGKGEYDDYDLYNGIANGYGLLGKGKESYNYFNQAIRVHPQKGLAFVNLAQLMTELGAYHTAHDAYAKAVALEPTVEFYWLSYVKFLAAHEPTADTTPAIFAIAKKATDSAPDVLIAEANWLADAHHFQDAIADWRKVRPIVGPAQQVAIDSEISRLQSLIQ